MFSIGEFSRITGFTVKTLRFYHEKGIVVPACVDDQTGYRYYDESGVDRARVVAHLRKLEFPLSEIYLKGPGMLFRGNPKNYLTEIQILTDGGAAVPWAAARSPRRARSPATPRSQAAHNPSGSA